MLGAALLAAVASCAPDALSDAEISEHQEHFSVAWSASQCTIARARRPTLQVCIQGNGDRANARAMTSRALEAWLAPLRERFEGIATGIEFGCAAPDITVNAYAGAGDGRGWGGPRVVSAIYDASAYGTWLHEFGHAFACLGDTYVGGIAGNCAAGQPRSVMCYGLLLNALTADDVNGVVAQARSLGFAARDGSGGGGATSCAALTTCGACTPVAGCGWCGASGACVPVDAAGNPTVACRSGFALYPSACSGGGGSGEACGAWEGYTLFTCSRDGTFRARCVGGRLERQACPSGCESRPVGVEDTCRSAGSAGDGDGDGVPDAVDRCPATPRGAWVWRDEHEGRWRGCAAGETPTR